MSQAKSIQSVERAMAVLETLAAHGGEARLTTLSESLGLNKSTLHGLLRTLLELGYISRREQNYTLGLRLREIAQPLQDADALIRTAFSPALRRLSAMSGETCWLAVPCGTREYLYIDAVEGGKNLRVASPRGKRERLTTSAIGRIFLAFNDDLLRALRKSDAVSSSLNGEISRIREQGFALDIGEAEEGLHCLALPLQQSGRVVAALGMAGPAARLHPDYMRRFAQRVLSEMFDIIKL